MKKLISKILKKLINNLQFYKSQGKSSPHDEQRPPANTIVTKLEENHISNMLLLNSKFIIDWSEKAGCTVVAKMIFQEMGLLKEALDYNSWIHNYREQVFYDKVGRVTKDMLYSGEYIKIKVVRNPYYRAVSSYFASNEKATDWQKNFQREFGDNLSFYEFLKVIKSGKAGNAHWNTQYCAAPR